MPSLFVRPPHKKQRSYFSSQTSRARNKHLHIITSLGNSKRTAADDDGDSALGSEGNSPFKKSAYEVNGSVGGRDHNDPSDLTAKNSIQELAPPDLSKVSAKPRTPTSSKRASMLEVEQEPVVAAASPEELTTRGIHVPSRTR
jgi:hypothetical protein